MPGVYLSSSQTRVPGIISKWAVYEKFYDYLYDSKFLVRTANNPQTYVLTTAKLDAEVSTFRFNIELLA